MGMGMGSGSGVCLPLFSVGGWFVGVGGVGVLGRL